MISSKRGPDNAITHLTLSSSELFCSVIMPFVTEDGMKYLPESRFAPFALACKVHVRSPWWVDVERNYDISLVLPLMFCSLLYVSISYKMLASTFLDPIENLLTTCMKVWICWFHTTYAWEIILRPLHILLPYSNWPGEILNHCGSIPET